MYLGKLIQIFELLVFQLLCNTAFECSEMCISYVVVLVSVTTETTPLALVTA